MSGRDGGASGAGPDGASRRTPHTWTERAGTWLSDEALTGLLIILIVDMFVLPSFGARIGQVAVDVVFTVLLLTGLAAVANRRVALAFVGVLVLGTLVLRWMAPILSLPGTTVGAMGTSLATMAVFALLVFLRTLSPGPITRRRIEGAVAAYLLVGMSFAIAYELVERVSPDSFQFAKGLPEVMEQAFGYYSIVTLTTVGYGDVTPLSPLARRLAMLEGLIGQLYPAIIIGWMVSSMKARQDD